MSLKSSIFKVGAVFTLGHVYSSGYRYVHFPRKNIIMKRGAIADYNSLSGEKVIVSGIERNNNGVAIATLRRENGLNFFRFFPKVEANLSMALKSGELRLQAS